jgi:hypothetical protein
MSGILDDMRVIPLSVVSRKPANKRGLAQSEVARAEPAAGSNAISQSGRQRLPLSSLMHDADRHGVAPGIDHWLAWPFRDLQ